MKITDVYILYKRYCSDEGCWDTVIDVYKSKKAADNAELNLTIRETQIIGSMKLT
jgi:hypothetical protein